MTKRAMRVLIRADGDAEMGTGHVMRTLALAERVLTGGGAATLLSVTLDASLRRRVEASGVAVRMSLSAPGSPADAAAVIAEAAAVAADWVVVDHYAAGGAFHHAVRDAGLRLLVIDDYAPGRIAADIVVNQNVHATPEMYNGRLDGEPTLLLGPAYALLRTEFADAARPRGVPERATHILVTLGGADPANVSGAVFDALLPLVRDPAAKISLTMVVGASNPHRDRLARAASGEARVEFQHSVTNMAPLMTRADLAVAGAGITVYELLALGVPTCVIPIVPSQRAFAAALGGSGACEALDEDGGFDARRFAARVDALGDDRVRRAAMSRLGQELVDGRGVERVLAAVLA